MKELQDLLYLYNADVLKTLAVKLGAGKLLTRKDQFIKFIVDSIVLSPGRFIERMTPIEQAMVSEAVHGVGRITDMQIQAKYGQKPPPFHPYSYSSYEREKEDFKAWPPLVMLVLNQYPRNGEYLISAPLIDLLKPHAPAPKAFAIKTTDTIPEVFVHPNAEEMKSSGYEYLDSWYYRKVQIHEGERGALLEARQFLLLAQAGKLKVSSQSLRPSEATTRRVAEALAAPDFDLEPPVECRDKYMDSTGAVRAHAWCVLLQQLGWAKASGETLKLTAAGKEAASGSLPQALRDAFDDFLNDDLFDELNRINHIRGQTGKGKRYLTELSERRFPISEAMAEWPVGQWIEFDEIARHLQAAGRDFDVTDDPYTLYFGEQQYGHWASGGDNLTRQYLRAFLMESLATLGMIDIAYVYPHGLFPEFKQSWGRDDLSFVGRYDGLLYARLNALGAYCLGVTETYAPPAKGGPLYQVLPNEEIVVIGAETLPEADRCMLEFFAQQVSDKVWALSAERLLNHLESGASHEEGLGYLRAHNAGELPECVTLFFENTARKAKAVQTIEDALLIEFASHTDAALVAHDSKAKDYCRFAGGAFLVVPRKNERAFRTAIKKLGFILPPQ